jgi:hypothetical protein
MESAIARYLRKHEEVKYSDGSPGATLSFDYTGVIYNLSNVPVSTSNISSIGNQISPRWYEIRAKMEVSAVCSYRFLVFQDTQNLGSSPATSDVIQSVTTAYAPVSALNFDNTVTQKRFKILLDKTFALDPDSNGALQFKRRIPLSGTIGRVTGATSGKNSLFLLIISDTSSPTGNLWAYWRLAFTDA